MKNWFEMCVFLGLHHVCRYRSDVKASNIVLSLPYSNYVMEQDKN